MKLIEKKFTGLYKDFQKYITQENINNNKVYTFYIKDESEEKNINQENQKKIWLQERFRNSEKSRILTPKGFDLIIEKAKNKLLTS
jgi:predicted CoA-binding protein